MEWICNIGDEIRSVMYLFEQWENQANAPSLLSCCPQKLTRRILRRTLTRAQGRRTGRFQITIHIPSVVAVLRVDIVQQSLTAFDSVADLAHEAHLIQRAARARDGFHAGVVEGAGRPTW
jgi:hypothetical protein